MMYFVLVIIFISVVSADAEPSWLSHIAQIPVYIPNPNQILDLLQGRRKTTTTTTVKPSGVTDGPTAKPVTLIGGPCANVCPGGEQQGAYCRCKPVYTICQWFNVDCD